MILEFTASFMIIDAASLFCSGNTEDKIQNVLLPNMLQ